MMIIDEVDDSIVSLANPEAIGIARQLFAPAWSGVVC